MGKLMGCMLVLTAAASGGFYMGFCLEERLRLLLEERRLLLMLEGEIRFIRSSFQEAFLSIGSRAGEPFASFFKETGKRLTGREGEFSSIWEEETKHLSGSHLKEADIREFSMLGQQLGYLDAEMQLKTIALYLEGLEQKLKELTGEIGQRKRLYHCLGILGGMMLLLVLL